MREFALNVAIAASCAALRPTATIPNATIVNRAANRSDGRATIVRSDGGARAPANVQTKYAGVATMSAASNEPTTMAAASVPTSAIDVITCSESAIAVRGCVERTSMYARRSRPTRTTISAASPIAPRSDRYAAPLGDSDVEMVFAGTQMREFAEAFGGYDPETWGAASRPRPISLEHELVLFVDTGGEVVVYEEPALVETVASLLMRRVGERWVVAGFRNPDDHVT